MEPPADVIVAAREQGGSEVAGFNNARTITKASAKGLDTRQDDYKKGICSPGSLVNNPVR